MLGEYSAGTALSHGGALVAVSALSTAAETSVVMLPASLATWARAEATLLGMYRLMSWDAAELNCSELVLWIVNAIIESMVGDHLHGGLTLLVLI